ncbi:hypothetical protein ACWGCW_14165 [Streptomyces sp. NPDC054933]
MGLSLGGELSAKVCRGPDAVGGVGTAQLLDDALGDGDGRVQVAEREVGLGLGG